MEEGGEGGGGRQLYFQLRSGGRSLKSCKCPQQREKGRAPSFTETRRGDKENLQSFLLILENLSSLWPRRERRKRINQSNIGTNTKVITQLESWSQMRTLEKYNWMSSQNYNYINQIKENIILVGMDRKCHFTNRLAQSKLILLNLM